jgi:Reverse transcriptase (RNA-dependent DNA polymerase)
MLWFGTAMPHSLINPNQLRAFGLDVNDDPFDTHRELGINGTLAFIPFDTTGTIVHFASRTPTRWEQEHLPVIALTGDQWDPTTVLMQPDNFSREVMELRSLQQDPAAEGPRYITAHTEVDSPLSSTLNPHTFCARVIEAVNIATAYRDDIDQRRASGVITNDRHSKVSPEELAKKWQIGIQSAKDTLQVTTQLGIRTALHPMIRRVRVDHLNIHRPRLRGQWFADTVHSKVKSKLGNTCANVFTQGKFTRVVPMESRKDAGKSLVDFTDDVGVPELLLTDGASEFTGKNTEFVKEARRMRIKLLNSEQGRKNQNHAAEREIGFLAKRWKLRMAKKDVPRRLWDFGLVYESEILARMARGDDRRTGYEEVTGQTPDISEWLDFEFYDLVWWLDRSIKPNVTDVQRRLARWLGVSHRVGSDLCYWLITDSGKIVSKTSVEHVIRDDYLNPETATQIDDFHSKLSTALHDDNFVIDGAGGFDSMWLDDVEIDDENPGVAYNPDLVPTEEEYGDMLLADRPEADEEEVVDRYINAELILDLGSGAERRGRVTKRARGLDGEPIGTSHANPLFDTREYLIEFTDGSVDRYRANIIAENMYAQVDDEGRQFLLLDEITDHKADNTAIPITDGTVRSANGSTRPKITTKGWSFLVQWKDGSSSWEKLKDLKESNPIEVAEYAVANRIVEEPALKWWVPQVLRRRNRIISKVKSRYWRTTHKFGIRLPKTVEEALEIDRVTGTDFWRKAINKEMSRVKIAWRVHEEHTPEQVRSGKVSEFIGFQEITCHIIFDVKMDFTRKARFVAGGHTTEAPTSLTYSSVVSRDSVRLGFLIAALNGVNIVACDLENAYLNAPCKEKIWFQGGIECGEDKGRVLVIIRALYGLKSAGNSWRMALAEVLTSLSFESTRADPDVWIRAAVRDDGFGYYEMLFVYVDDILAISHKAKEVLLEITKFYKAKEGSMKEPDLYLGANVGKLQTPEGNEVWYTSPRDYVKNAIVTVEKLLDEDNEGYMLKNSAKNPFPNNYKPELDATDELDDRLASRYLQLIGICRWAIEIGRIDIFLETSLLSQYQANPRVGHLEALYHVFAYLKRHPDMGRLAYDPKTPVIDETAFHHTADWHDFYGDVVEELPAKLPAPRGNPVIISAFVDANHAGNVVTRRSHTGLIIFVQNAPIIFYSKRQNTVEAATFGSEFVALRICKELIVALRYKLRMFGIPVDGPANVFCDNRGVVKNASIPESVLMKKHNSINYHAVREAAAAGILRVGKEDGQTNLADLLTKVVDSKKRWELCWHFMW